MHILEFSKQYVHQGAPATTEERELQCEACSNRSQNASSMHNVKSIEKHKRIHAQAAEFDGEFAA